jgi:predicted site-specific integrase-resolvase
MQMLRVSRRTMDNYIKAGKLTPTRIRKRNYFAIEDVKKLMHVPQSPQISSFRADAQILMSRLAKIEKAGGE